MVGGISQGFNNRPPEFPGAARYCDDGHGYYQVSFKKKWSWKGFYGCHLSSKLDDFSRLACSIYISSINIATLG
jgi:hypothetical protein